MADLVLGNSPEKLTVNLVSNDPVDFSLVLKQAGTPYAWPSPPVLEFSTGSWVATVDVETGSIASWAATEEQVNTVLALDDKKVRLSVDEITWWAGVVVKRA